MVATFGNVSANRTADWVDEPDGRGSWSILSSCVITISLCAWTALHLNIPEHKKANRQWMRKSKWLLLGLVAPEVVAYIAWCQRQEAKRLVQDVRRGMGHDEPISRFRVFRRCWLGLRGRFKIGRKKQKGVVSAPSSPCTTRFDGPAWTLVHGFYATMGGFAISTTNMDHAPDGSSVTRNFLPGSRTRAALTSSGLRFLLEHDISLLPHLSKEEIQDKSKADGVKKTLVCTQALWFVLSCLTRLANSLPISLLELNALAHAACALVIYAMWWHKPLDVEEPTLLHDNSDGSLAKLAAYMWMDSSESAKGLEKWNWSDWLRSEFDALWPAGPPQLKDLLIGHTTADLTHASTYDGKITQYMSSEELELLPLWHPFRVSYPAPDRPVRDIESIFRGRKYLHASFLRQRFFYPYEISNAPTASRATAAVTHISPATLQRWSLAYAAIDRFALNADLRTRHHTATTTFFRAHDRLKTRIPNHAAVLKSNALDAWVGFVLAGFAYGGLHLLAWDGSFRSPVEKILWRVSASSIVGSAAVLAPLVALFEVEVLNKGLKDLWRVGRKDLRDGNGNGNENVGTGWRWRYWGYMAVVVGIMPLVVISPLLSGSYIVGRVFLVAECFIDLAYLPRGAFEDVGWPKWIPHVT